MNVIFSVGSFVAVSHQAVVANEKSLKLSDRDPWSIFLVYSLGEVILSCPFTIFRLLKRPKQPSLTKNTHERPFLSSFLNRPIVLVILCIFQLLAIYLINFVHEPFTLTFAKALCPILQLGLMGSVTYIQSKLSSSILILYIIGCLVAYFMHGMVEPALVLAFSCLYFSRVYLLHYVLVDLHVDLWLCISIVSTLSAFPTVLLMVTFKDLQVIKQLSIQPWILIKGVIFSTLAQVWFMKIIEEMGQITALFCYSIYEFSYLLRFYSSTTLQPIQVPFLSICLIAAIGSLLIVKKQNI